MKMNCIINTARFLNCFGKVWLIKGQMKNMNWRVEATKITPKPNRVC